MLETVLAAAQYNPHAFNCPAWSDACFDTKCHALLGRGSLVLKTKKVKYLNQAKTFWMGIRVI